MIRKEGVKGGWGKRGGGQDVLIVLDYRLCSIYDKGFAIVNKLPVLRSQSRSRNLKASPALPIKKKLRENIVKTRLNKIWLF